MLSLGILLGFFAASVGVMLFFATKEKKIALPLVFGGVAIAAYMMSIMIMHVGRIVMF